MSGIPSMLIDEAIPFMNEHIGYYLDQIGSRYIVSFDTLNKNKGGEQQTLFGLDKNNLEFNVNTLNAVSKFLQNIGVEQRLVPQILSENGSVVEGAIAAANFLQNTVDILDDVNKRPEAWNKLPEEAAHWWYRRLNSNSVLSKALWDSALTTHKAEELKNSLYGDAYDGETNPLKEEAIGQLIAEAIKRIEDKNGKRKTK